MAVFVPAVNGLEVGLHFTDQNNDENVNVFWVQNSAAWTATSVMTMLDAFITWFHTGDGTHTYASEMATVVALTSVTGRDFTTQHGISLVDQSGLPITGTAAVAPVAAGTTKALTARTGLAGKNFRGRTYVAGLQSGAVPVPSNGLVLASAMSTLVSAFNALPAAVTAAIATCHLVVCSRFYQPGGPGTPTVPRATAVMTPVTVFGYHDLNVDFQRRRAPGHQRHH